MAHNEMKMTVRTHIDTGTPLRQDKRFWLTVGVNAGLFVLALLGIERTACVAGIVTLTTAFLAQSQLGQSYRAGKVAESAPAIHDDVDEPAPVRAVGFRGE